MTAAGLTAVAACRLAQSELARDDARFFVLEAETWEGAEASLIGAAGGLALAGKIPLVNLLSSAALIRACEQVRLDLCYHHANAKLFGSFEGSIEDLALARSLPNLTIIAPADAAAAYRATLAAGAHAGPVYIRLAQHMAPEVYDAGCPLQIGRGIVLRDGSDLTLVAAGLGVVAEALAAAELLRRDGIDARVIDLHTIKPIDRALLKQAAEETGLIITVEEHPVRGGMGGAVAEVLGDECPVPMRILGIPEDCRVMHRLHDYGLDAQGIAASARRALEEQAA
ncbi:MAG TPA: transketolase C-terminal domain-containing protein [Thermoanaerobaculia bacterium]|jgi:transketolase|nr:transketolase C-terminal domain-containing protein [Thermoanaerobaculia bacterium]